MKTSNEHQEFELPELIILKDFTHSISGGIFLQHYLAKRLNAIYTINLNRTAYSGVTEPGGGFDGPGTIEILPTYILSHSLNLGLQVTSKWNLFVGGYYIGTNKITYEQNKNPAWGGVTEVYHEERDVNVFGLNIGITYILDRFELGLKYSQDLEREVVHSLQHDPLRAVSVTIGYRFKLFDEIDRTRKSGDCPKL